MKKILVMLTYTQQELEDIKKVFRDNNVAVEDLDLSDESFIIEVMNITTLYDIMVELGCPLELSILGDDLIMLI